MQLLGIEETANALGLTIKALRVLVFNGKLKRPSWAYGWESNYIEALKKELENGK